MKEFKFYNQEIQSILGKRKVAIYVRESTKAQAVEGYNIRAQEDMCTAYVKGVLCENNFIVYREKGYSAKTIDRPVMNDMLRDIEHGKIKTVIVQRLDRLARRNRGIADLADIFKEYGVRMITLREHLDSDTDMWKLFMNIFIMYAEIEQDQISERTVQALTYAAEQGSYIKGGAAPFGTCKEKVYFDDGGHIYELRRHPWQWKVLEMIYEMANEGYNCKQISLTVSDLDIMKENQKKLSDDTIGKILSNKIYKGIMEFQGKEYKVKFEDHMNEEYWEQVQINRSVNLNGSPMNEYLYHGKVKCSCGAICVVDVSNKRLADGTIKKYKYYVCPHCGKRISERDLYNRLEKGLEAGFEVRKNEAYKKEQEKKIERVERLNSDLYDMYLKGVIGTTTYVEQLEKGKEKQRLFRKRIATKRIDYNKLSFEDRKEWIDDNVKCFMVDMKNKHATIEYRV